MEKIYNYIDANTPRFISELITLIKQPSISSQRVGLEECAKLLAGMMEKVGITSKILPMGGRNNPPLVYGEILSSGAKKTLLIYGHFDVQPPEPLEEWHSPPFQPTIRNGRIYARGSSDNKGQLFAHIKAVEAIMKTTQRMPVSVKFLFDPEEEIGSPSLEDFVCGHKDLFSADLAYNSDGPIDPSGHPKLIFGCRGSCYVEINYQGANRDLHSGQFGGPVPNPNWRVVEFLSTLRDSRGRVAIEGFYDNVVPPTTAEMEAIANIPFDEAKTLQYLGLKEFFGPKEMGYWEKIMFQPTMNICGYASGYGGEGTKTIIPHKTRVKIDMRLVKNQTPNEIFQKFGQHMVKYGFHDLELKLLSTFNPMKAPIDHPMSKAVIESVRKGFQSEPILFPVSGGSNPTSAITDHLGIPVINVPYASHDQCNHAPNENMVIDLFVKGIKTSAAVFYELTKL